MVVTVCIMNTVRLLTFPHRQPLPPAPLPSINHIHSTQTSNSSLRFMVGVLIPETGAILALMLQAVVFTAVGVQIKVLWAMVRLPLLAAGRCRQYLPTSSQIQNTLHTHPPHGCRINQVVLLLIVGLVGMVAGPLFPVRPASMGIRKVLLTLYRPRPREYTRWNINYSH